MQCHDFQAGIRIKKGVKVSYKQRNGKTLLHILETPSTITQTSSTAAQITIEPCLKSDFILFFSLFLLWLIHRTSAPDDWRLRSNAVFHSYATYAISQCYIIVVYIRRFMSVQIINRLLLHDNVCNLIEPTSKLRFRFDKKNAAALLKQRYTALERRRRSMYYTLYKAPRCNQGW